MPDWAPEWTHVKESFSIFRPHSSGNRGPQYPLLPILLLPQIIITPFVQPLSRWAFWIARLLSSLCPPCAPCDYHLGCMGALSEKREKRYTPDPRLPPFTRGISTQKSAWLAPIEYPSRSSPSSGSSLLLSTAIPVTARQRIGVSSSVFFICSMSAFHHRMVSSSRTESRLNTHHHHSLNGIWKSPTNIATA